MFYELCKGLVRIFFVVFFRIKVYGRENIPRRGGFIIASNHVSMLDPPAVGSSCQRKLNYMARHDLFRNFFFGRLLKGVNVFPVKRNSPDLSALKEAIKRIRRGEGLLLFPEGTRQVDNAVAEPQPGIGFLVAKTGAPVIPAYISGSQNALPKGCKFVKFVPIKVFFGKEISIEKGMSYEGIASRIMQEIRSISKNSDEGGFLLQD